MNKLLVVSLTLLVACGGGGAGGLTQYQVCSRISEATCSREATCKPGMNKASCIAREMDACCPGGACDEPTLADARSITTCEDAIAAMSCSALDGGDLPAACDGLDVPDDDPPAETGVVEIAWNIYAGSTSASCRQFYGATTLRAYLTTPSGTTTTRDFTCDAYSGLANVAHGVYSIRAELRTGNGTVIQQSVAHTVTVDAIRGAAELEFRVTTAFGHYCDALADKACATCAPSDTSCWSSYYGACCHDAGRCGSPAAAEAGAWNQCLAAVGTGQYCSGSTSPSACSGVITVW